MSLVEAIDNGGSYEYVGTENIWEISEPYSQFCSESKTTLQNKIYFKNLQR